MSRLIIFLLCLFLTPFNLHAFQKTYYISIVPMYAPGLILNYYSPLIDYVKKETKTNWELRYYHTHKDLVRGFCNKEIDIAFSGPVPFALAKKDCSAKELIVALNSDGRPYYNSVIFTSNRGIKFLKDLQDKKFGYVKGSTLAHVVPFKMLEDAGIKVQPVAFKRHEEIIKAVLSGEIAAGGVKESLFKKFSSQSNIFMIERSQDIPNFIFFAQGDIDKNVAKEFIKALIKLKPLQNPKHREITSTWDDEAKNGFIMPTKEYLQKLSLIADWTNRYIKD